MTRNLDASQRFLFEQADVRGESVRLGPALSELLDTQTYSHSVRRLLGEFAAAAVLISNNLKYTGRIILQARSEAALSLVMVECSSERHIRGIAQGDLSASAVDPMTLLQNGQLALTIERELGQRYQGIIALEGRSLAVSLDSYFAQSEQLGARFWLGSDGDISAGLMLQQLPAQLNDGAAREEHWSTLCVLAETTSIKELLALSPEELLFKLYHEETVKLYPPAPILFKCRCSQERSADTIALLAQSDRDEIIAELGEIALTCELCGAVYRFGQSALDKESDTRTLH
ncbi:MAG: Hsp33 family molecular chaperone HslO [Luminiphilus sp.]|nr:Hsp33 family molecular chaperone HslO [Luminiphilus sp.]